MLRTLKISKYDQSTRLNLHNIEHDHSDDEDECDAKQTAEYDCPGAERI